MSDHTIYWFSRDLRIHDNQALTMAKDSASLLCIYIVDPNWFTQTKWQCSQLGSLRWQFILDCLENLNTNLRNLGQELHIYYGEPGAVLGSLFRQYESTQLVLTRMPGTQEKSVINAIRRNHSNVQIRQIDQYTLFDRRHLPFSLSEWPRTYSRFRKKAESYPVLAPTPSISKLPPQPNGYRRPPLNLPSWAPNLSSHTSPFKGGEDEAEDHLDRYFNARLPSSYKTVRNSLEGWDNSSKLSPWLSQGCLTPRQIKSRLVRYEQSYGRNESTIWLYVELLWREYFQWLSHSLGSQIFTFKGLAANKPLTTYYAERFQKWRDGSTPYALVNACMKELKATGYMSNRGRQIVASCLVNELGIDWRYGAAWFEHQLVDYDCAANWCNWQYIAGVGVDPRGGRHFNLDKQTELYDPFGHYRQKWGGQNAGPLDSVDAADWPIMPEESPS